MQTPLTRPKLAEHPSVLQVVVVPVESAVQVSQLDGQARHWPELSTNPGVVHVSQVAGVPVDIAAQVAHPAPQATQFPLTTENPAAQFVQTLAAVHIRQLAPHAGQLAIAVPSAFITAKKPLEQLSHPVGPAVVHTPQPWMLQTIEHSIEVGSRSNPGEQPPVSHKSAPFVAQVSQLGAQGSHVTGDPVEAMKPVAHVAHVPMPPLQSIQLSVH